MTLPKGYSKIQLPFDMGERALFGEGRFALYKSDSDLSSKGHISFEPVFHGPPQYAHGGAQAYILDEVMGCTGWMHGFKVVAKTIQVDFVQPCPIETELVLVGKILTEKRQDLLQIEAQILDPENKIISKSLGDFRILSGELLKQFSVGK